MTPNQHFAKILQDEQITQAQASRLLGITPSSVNDILSSYTRMSYERLAEYAGKLGYEMQVAIKKAPTE